MPDQLIFDIFSDSVLFELVSLGSFWKICYTSMSQKNQFYESYKKTSFYLGWLFCCRICYTWLSPNTKWRFLWSFYESVTVLVVRILPFQCWDGTKVVRILPFQCWDGMKVVRILPFQCWDGTQVVRILPFQCWDGIQVVRILPFQCWDGTQVVRISPFQCWDGTKHKVE